MGADVFYQFVLLNRSTASLWEKEAGFHGEKGRVKLRNGPRVLVLGEGEASELPVDL